MTFRRVLTAIFALCSALTASACGVSQDQYLAKQDELTRCQREVTRAQAETTQARSHTDELSRVGTQLRERVSELESDHSRLQAGLSANQQELSELRRAHVALERRLALYRSLGERLKPLIDGGLVVLEQRRGKLVVRFSESSLFEPGKLTVRTQGESPLREVAAALREIPDRDFIVAGHTDNTLTLAKGSTLRSNWELSAARAIAVVRFLQSEGVDPRHLAAAGYSEFDNLRDNESGDGRALNRRIEITVQPGADELLSSPTMNTTSRRD